MSDLDTIRERHVACDDAPPGNPLNECAWCSDSWPCDTGIVLDALDVAQPLIDALRFALSDARADAERLAEALRRRHGYKCNAPKGPCDACEALRQYEGSDLAGQTDRTSQPAPTKPQSGSTADPDIGTAPRIQPPAIPAFDPSVIIYRARGGWIVQMESEIEPGYWPIEVVTGDTALIDFLWEVLGLDSEAGVSVPADRTDASGPEEQTTLVVGRTPPDYEGAT